MDGWSPYKKSECNILLKSVTVKTLSAARQGKAWREREPCAPAELFKQLHPTFPRPQVHTYASHEDGTSHPTITTYTTRPDRKPSMPMVQYVQSPRSRIPQVPMCDDFHVHVPCMRLCGCASAYACMALAGGMPPSLLICVASRDTPPPAFGCLSIITRRRSTMC